MNQNENINLTTTLAKVLLPINNSQTFKLKKCKNCNIEKLYKEFYSVKETKDGLYYICKDCQSEYKNKYCKTLNGCFQSLLNNSKTNCKYKKDKGRINAGMFDITLSNLENLWLKQNGRCYYSNIPMNYDKKDWKLSLERLNPDKGYIKDNIVLCCQEFNGSSQWTKEKIKKMIDILDEDIIRHTFSLDLEETQRKKYQRITKTIIDDIEYYKCSKCNKNKTKNMFNKSLSSGCKECIAKRDKIKKNNPRNSLQRLIAGAKKSTKERIKKNNIKRDNSFNIDFDYLIELYNKQRGLCAYSNLPLQFGSYLENNWTCSLERIDVLKGYKIGRAHV